MFRLRIISSVLIFSFLLIGTSFIKNETRDIEKKIFNISNKIYSQKKDLNELQLDFSYLSSPSIIEKKIELFDNSQYIPMEHSKIFLSISSFTDLQGKFVNKNKNYEEKNQKNF